MSITLTSLVHPTMIVKIRDGLKYAALGEGHKMHGHNNRVYIANRHGRNILRIDWIGQGKFIAYGDESRVVTEMVKAAIQRGCSANRVKPRQFDCDAIKPEAGRPSLKSRLVKLAALCGVTATLTACGPVLPGAPLSEYQWLPDQTLRAQLFDKCLTALPAGPVKTHYNDWSEVVKQCEDSSYAQSKRLAKQDKSGVWVFVDVK